MILCPISSSESLVSLTSQGFQSDTLVHLYIFDEGLCILVIRDGEQDIQRGTSPREV
jgi:hypothetical protein